MNNNFILKDSNKIEFSVEGKGYIKVYPPLTDIEITPNKETQTFKNNEEYGYDHVTVNPIPENYIDPTGSLTIKENGVKNVRNYQNVVVDVKAEIPEIKLQNKEITPTKSSHDIVADNGYDGLSKVRVNPIPSDYIKPTGTKIITENGTVNISTYENVNVNVEAPEVEIKLQDKEVIPTKEIQNIKADTDYDGLSEVTVNAIPDEYIIPDGMLPITENTTYDVRRYATVSASVHPAPTLQDKSITVTENGTQTVTADSGYDGLGEVNVTVEVEGSGGGGILQPFTDKGLIYEDSSTSKNMPLMNLNIRNLPNMLLVFWFARSNCTISDNVTVLYQSETVSADGQNQTLYIGYMSLSITNWNQLNDVNITVTQETSGRLGIGAIPLTNSDIPVIVEETGSTKTADTLSFKTDEYLNFYIWTQIFGTGLKTNNKYPILNGDRIGYFTCNAPDNDFTVNWTGGSCNRFIQVRCSYKKA